MAEAIAIDGIINTTPNNVHLETTRQAAEAGATADLPLRSPGMGYQVIVPGLNEPEADQVQVARTYAVSENAFEALGMTLLRGRIFAASDGPPECPD